MSVYSFYVKKRSPETPVKEVKHYSLVKRYLVEGQGAEALIEKALFHEPVVEDIYTTLPDFVDPRKNRVFVTEFLPGQFDQEAYIYAQCMSLANGGPRPLLRCAKIYVLDKDLSEDAFKSFKDWIINPVESREISLDIPDTLHVDYGEAEEVAQLNGFISLDEAGLKTVLAELGLAMDLEDLAFCQAYFRDEETRDPSITEIRMIDTYWSDHCRHTTFLTELKKIEIKDESIKKSFERYSELRKELKREDKPITMMDMATIGARALKARALLNELDESEEVNAACVKIKANVNGKLEDWLLYFKNETHNHPTEMEPFGGAATCLGGGIRDPLSGRSYVHQAMRITGAGDPRVPVDETLPGKLPQIKICRTAADGYSSYGNQVGVASGHVHEIYHPGYIAKRLELGALVAAAPEANVVRHRPIAGDLVILLGGKTGRDGIGGATGSSKTQQADALETSGSEVQKGDALEERKIIRLFRKPEATLLIKRCNDFGAGGVSVAIGELADGLDIDLDKVPVKHGGLGGTDLAISESQERMAVVVAEKDADKFIELATAENLEATIVAVVTDKARLCMSTKGKTIVDLSRAFLNSNGTAKQASALIEAPLLPDKNTSALDREGFIQLLSELSFCSQKGLIERFDYSVGAATMLSPLGGAQQLSPAQAMAAKLPVLDGDTTTSSLMAWGFDPYISTQSPYHGAIAAVLHSVAKIIASGGSRSQCWLSFQEYFERLGNEESRWGKPVAALLGALDAQLALECAAIGGKDSMSGSFNDIDVPPTLVSFAVSVSSNIISTEFKDAGSKVYHLQADSDFASLRNLFDKVEALIASGKVKSAWALGSGGTAEAIAKMSFGNRIGFSATKALTRAPDFGAFILEAEELEAYEDCLLGLTTREYKLKLADASYVDMADMQAAWEATLEKVYPSHAAKSKRGDFSHCEEKPPHVSIKTQAAPKFLMPLFPGTNSEYDTQKAVLAAGGQANTIVIRNRDEKSIAESIQALAEEIRSAQGLILPGGDLSADYIVACFRNPEIRDALADLLDNRKGLVCGIGAGFRALAKLGFLGEIALSENKIGRHHSQMATVQVISNKSPWFSGYKLGEPVLVPVSSESGRLIASDSVVRAMAKNGQIATQYALGCDPFGSDFAIEAITSLDGRILGRMGHAERLNNTLFVNIPGNKNMNIFEGAIKYFS